MKLYVIGLDIETSRIKYRVMDEEGIPGAIEEIPSRSDEGPAAVVEQLRTAINSARLQLPPESRLVGVTVATAGLITSDGLITGEAVNIPGWRDIPLGEMIEEMIKVPVQVYNDAHCSALAEYVYGAAEDVRNMVCISLGKVIGGGIIINDELYCGESGFSGEIGHLIVEPEGIECSCGQRGCLDRYASGEGIIFNCKRLAPDFITALSELCRTNPEWLTAELIYNYAREEDKLALEINELACRMLARGIGHIINLLAPDMVVLCGAVMNSRDIILPRVLDALPLYSVETLRAKCLVVPGQLEDDAGVTGAALHALEEFIVSDPER